MSLSVQTVTAGVEAKAGSAGEKFVNTLTTSSTATTITGMCPAPAHLHIEDTVSQQQMKVVLIMVLVLSALLSPMLCTILHAHLRQVCLHVCLMQASRPCTAILSRHASSLTFLCIAVGGDPSIVSIGDATSEDSEENYKAWIASVQGEVSSNGMANILHLAAMLCILASS